MTPWTTACQALLCRNSLGKNTGVGCHALLQEIFPTQGLNPGFLHCKQTLIPETPEKPLRCTKFRFRTRQSKMTAQRKFGMTHISDSSYHEAATLSPPVCLSTCTVLFFLLTNILLVSLLFVFVGILFLQSQGLVTHHWSSS